MKKPYAITIGNTGLLGGGVDPGASYAQLLINTYGATEVWRLNDIVSGTAVLAQVNTARNGTLTGWTLQNGTSPVSGDQLKAPFSDGTNDYADLLTSGGGVGLVDIFDTTEGGVFWWAQVTNVGVWTDGSTRRLFQIQSTVGTGGGYVTGLKINPSTVRLNFNGQLRDATSVSTTDWFSVGISWSQSANKVLCALNGVQLGADDTYASWPTPTLGLALLGATAATPTNVWNGWLSLGAVKFGTYWTIADYLAMHNAAG